MVEVPGWAIGEARRHRQAMALFHDCGRSHYGVSGQGQRGGARDSARRSQKRATIHVLLSLFMGPYI